MWYLANPIVEIKSTQRRWEKHLNMKKYKMYKLCKYIDNKNKNVGIEIWILFIML